MAVPQPKPNADSKYYWDAAAEGRLVYQFCRACDAGQFYPRSLCAHCQSSEWEWRTSMGEGRIASFTEVMRAPTAAFKEMTPYVIALVDLNEGFRMMVNIVEGDRKKLAIGAPIRIVFREVDGFTLPQGSVT